MTARLQSLGAMGQEIIPLSLLASRIKNVPLRLKKLLTWGSQEPGNAPIYYHPRISSENSFFLKLSGEQGCNR